MQGPKLSAKESTAKSKTIETFQAPAQKITPFLWFDTEAEEAANYYVSIFPNSKIVSITRYGEAGPRPKGTVLTVLFELDGQQFVALNGGPEFKFTEAVSLLRELHKSGRSRRVLAKTQRRRRRRAVRVAERQVWSVMASEPQYFGRDAE